MRTKAIFRCLLFGGALVWGGHSFGQASVLGNSGGPTDYLGWDNTNPFPLPIRHDGNQPIQWFTDAIQRLMLYPTNNATLNSFNVPRHGFVAISPQPLFYNAPGAFTRLHLVDSVNNDQTTYAQDPGYRPWMRNGVTMTGNSDQMYVGHKYAYVDSSDYTSGEIDDRSDAVIEWSDNPDDSPWGTDRLRFMFTNAYSTASPASFGARSLEGMEAMRIFIPTDTTAHVGIGDFFRAGVINGQNEDPTERLHVNDGTVRIDSLIPDYQDDTLHQVLMSDMQGRVHWRNINTWPPTGGSGGCEWGSDAPTGRIYTAFQLNTTNGTCPEEDWKVGIGVAWPAAKLDVFGNYSMIGQPTGHGCSVARTCTEVRLFWLDYFSTCLLFPFGMITSVIVFRAYWMLHPFAHVLNKPNGFGHEWSVPVHIGFGAEGSLSLSLSLCAHAAFR